MCHIHVSPLLWFVSAATSHQNRNPRVRLLVEWDMFWDLQNWICEIANATKILDPLRNYNIRNRLKTDNRIEDFKGR
jgi:hypothetical protein